MVLCSSGDGVPLKFKKKNGRPPVYQHGLFEHTIDPAYNSLDNTFKHFWTIFRGGLDGSLAVDTKKRILAAWSILSLILTHPTMPEKTFYLCPSRKRELAFGRLNNDS
jgi:hypothetical protein